MTSARAAARRRTLLIAIAALLLLTAAIAALGGRKNGAVLALNAGKEPVYACCGNNLLAASSDGLTAYDARGRQLVREEFDAQRQCIDVCGKYALVWDAGGAALRLWNGREFTLREPGGAIVTASAHARGYVCAIAQNAAGCAVTVSDSRGEGVYSVSLGGVPIAARLSPEGGRLAILEADASGARLGIYRLDSENAVGFLDIEGDILCALQWLGEDALCAVGAESAVFADGEGNLIARLGFEAERVRSFAFAEDFAALAVENAGGVRLISLSASGKTLAERDFSEVRSLRACRGGVCLICEGEALLLDARLRRLGAFDAGGASGVVPRQDGGLLLIYSDRAVIRCL